MMMLGSNPSEPDRALSESKFLMPGSEEDPEASSEQEQESAVRAIDG